MRAKSLATRDPRTPGEWQEAVDMAEFLLLLDSARQYALITGGPEIDAVRCAELVLTGKALGCRPSTVPVLLKKYMEGRFA
jgi:hypothetical protein